MIDVNIIGKIIINLTWPLRFLFHLNGQQNYRFNCDKISFTTTIYSWATIVVPTYFGSDIDSLLIYSSTKRLMYNVHYVMHTMPFISWPFKDRIHKSWSMCGINYLKIIVFSTIKYNLKLSIAMVAKLRSVIKYYPARRSFHDNT